MISLLLSGLKALLIICAMFIVIAFTLLTIWICMCMAARQAIKSGRGNDDNNRN